MLEEIRFEGASVMDVCYTHETQGSFNVTRILSNLDADFIQRVRFPFNDSIVEGNRNADVCQELIDKMTPDHAKRPIVLMGCEDGTAFVVDGNNRLRWLITHGFNEARAHFIPYEHREQFRVKIFYKRNGEWQEENSREFLQDSIGIHHPRAAGG